MKKATNNRTIRVKRSEWERMDHTLAVVTHELEKAQGKSITANSPKELFAKLKE